MSVGVDRQSDNASSGTRGKLFGSQLKTLIHRVAVAGSKDVSVDRQFMHPGQLIFLTEVQISAVFAQVDPEVLRQSIRVKRAANVEHFCSKLSKALSAARPASTWVKSNTRKTSVGAERHGIPVRDLLDLDYERRSENFSLRVSQPSPRLNALQPGTPNSANASSSSSAVYRMVAAVIDLRLFPQSRKLR
jgi:hypothetical protein